MRAIEIPARNTIRIGETRHCGTRNVFQDSSAVHHFLLRFFFLQLLQDRMSDRMGADFHPFLSELPHLRPRHHRTLAYPNIQALCELNCGAMSACRVLVFKPLNLLLYQSRPST